MIPPPPGLSKPNQKHSIGIACIRIVENKMQILMISKRCTYAYGEFVQGKYPNGDPKRNKDELIKLFSGMTVQEKLDILSFDFDQIWYRFWLNATKSHSYYNKMKSKFESVLMFDGSSKLRKLINKSKNSSIVWEIPKGRRKQKEPDIHCAIREFAEETNISKKAYSIIPGIKRTFSFTDDGIEYINTYYVAMAKHDIEPSVNFGSQEQINEIGDIKWMDIDMIKIIDSGGYLESFIRPLFKTVKNRMKKVKQRI